MNGRNTGRSGRQSNSSCRTVALSRSRRSLKFVKKFDEPFRSCVYHRKLVKPYPVPYRCLYATDVRNLFLAGRHISASHVAFGAVRVMRTLGILGEVVGMAATICAKEDIYPRDVYRSRLDDDPHAKLPELFRWLETPGKNTYQVELEAPIDELSVQMLFDGAVCSIESLFPAKNALASTVRSLDDDGWRTATDPKNERREAQWFIAPREKAKPTEVPWIIQDPFPSYHGVAWYWRTFERRRILMPAGGICCGSGRSIIGRRSG